MRKLLITTALILTLAIGLCVSSASAALVTSLSGGTAVTMPVIDYPDYYTAGPVAFGPGITFTSTYDRSVFGFDRGFRFDENGRWYGLTMASVNDSSGTMTFTFDDPVTSVGGFINYGDRDSQYTYGIPTIAVYDTDGGLIEQAVLSFNTYNADNSGFFYGFLESSAMIGSFTLSNAYIGITNMVIDGQGSTVPEPGTMLLMGAGLLGAGLIRRRMKKA